MNKIIINNYTDTKVLFFNGLLSNNIESEWPLNNLYLEHEQIYKSAKIWIENKFINPEIYNNANILASLQEIINGSTENVSFNSAHLGMESIPTAIPLNEKIVNLLRIYNTNEYHSDSGENHKSSKQDLLKENKKIYDFDYAKHIYRGGFKTKCVISNNIISINAPIYRVINVPIETNLQIYCYYRHVPFSMKKIKTSDYSENHENFIFIYPEYLIRNTEAQDAIEKIECHYENGTNIENIEIYIGTDDTFEPVSSYGSTINSLNRIK